MLRRRHSLFWFLIGVLIILLTTLLTELVNAQETIINYNITLYEMTTDKQLVVAWDDTNPEMTEDFEFYIWNRGEQKKYAIGKTQALTATIMIPRTGLYSFFCRACADVVVDTDTGATEYKCSAYASSDMLQEDGTPYGKVKDPATGEYTPGKWMVYGHVAAPTGGGVE